MRQFYGTIWDRLEALTKLNQAGFNVFVCVNAIDTPAYETDERGKVKAKRRKTDVTRVRAVFGDFDDPSQPLPDFRLHPSMVVATSPGKHHVYWRTDDVPLTGVL